MVLAPEDLPDGQDAKVQDSDIYGPSSMWVFVEKRYKYFLKM